MSVEVVFSGDGISLVLAVRPCQMFLELLVVRFSSRLSQCLALPVLMAYSAAYLAYCICLCYCLCTRFVLNQGLLLGWLVIVFVEIHMHLQKVI